MADINDTQKEPENQAVSEIEDVKRMNVYPPQNPKNQAFRP